MRERLPPSASRIAISLRRAVPRASNMLARLRHATTNTTMAMPRSSGAILSNPPSPCGLVLVEERETGVAMKV